jgi:predicted nuclease with TOPRIM domain
MAEKTPEYVADVNRRVRDFESRYDEHMAEHNAGAKKLERLKTARTTLKTKQESLEDLKSDLRNVKNRLLGGAFKGSLRTTYDDAFEALEDAFKADINSFSSNLWQLDTEIFNLELQQSALGDVIASISATIQSLWDLL